MENSTVTPMSASAQPELSGTNQVPFFHRVPSRKKTLWVIGVILLVIVIGAIIYEVVITSIKNKELKLQHQYQAQQQQQALQVISSFNSVGMPVTGLTAAQKQKIAAALTKDSAMTPSSKTDLQAAINQVQAEQNANYQAWKSAQAKASK